MRIGSLFSGAGGLDMAVEQVFGGRTVWHCELDEAASKVLAHRWPGVPNLGDITAVDWSTVEPIDVLCGGFPCQDVSAAGRRAGIAAGTRSGLWLEFANVIDRLRPPIVVIENVRGLLSGYAHRAVESVNLAVGDGSGRPVLRGTGTLGSSSITHFSTAHRGGGSTPRRSSGGRRSPGQRRLRPSRTLAEIPGSQRLSLSG